MKHINRILFTCFFIGLAVMPGFSQVTQSSTLKVKSKTETSKSEGLVKLAEGSQYRHMDIDIDEEALEASIEKAIESAMKSVESALEKLEKLEINIEPIEINLNDTNIDVDPVLINIPDLDIHIEPMKIDLDDMDIVIDLDEMDLDMHHDHFDWKNDEDAGDHDHSIDKDKHKNKEKDKIDKSTKATKDKSKGLKKIN
jgi:hypothetical protein